jgi:hypothetical protein
MPRLPFHALRLTARVAALATIGSSLLLAACASTPPAPTVALNAAEQAIATADRARIADANSPDLSEAREKLAAANIAVQGKKMVEAERLAYESRADAELSAARSDAAKAVTVNDEMKRSTESLKQEMQRNSGAAQ